jgi:glycopeptide antibiotics resistance protein
MSSRLALTLQPRPVGFRSPWSTLSRIKRMGFSDHLSKPLKIGMQIALIGYVLIVAYWMLYGFERHVQAGYHYNLVPLRTIKTYLHVRHSHTRLSALNLIGNIAVFIPFGGLIPLAMGGRWWRMMLVSTLGVCLLEGLQLVSKRGIFDVDDILLNTLGAMIGYLCLFILWALLRLAGGLAAEQR